MLAAAPPDLIWRWIIETFASINICGSVFYVTFQL